MPDLESLRRAWNAEPSQETGLPLASALEAAGALDEALVVGTMALTFEKDFSQSEITPWRIEEQLRELCARIRFPRANIGDHEWEWPAAGGNRYGARTSSDRDGIYWYVRYPTGKLSGDRQPFASFVAYGPEGSCGPDPDAVRALAKLLDAEGEPWFRARYA
jgi:hypothetical protein